jgi:putative transposase
LLALIDKQRLQFLVKELGKLLELKRSSYYAYTASGHQPDVQRVLLRARVAELFNVYRGSAGRRTLRDQMTEEGFIMGRFKVLRLMHEAELQYRQQGQSPKKKCGQACVDIPNLLNRQFDVPQPYKMRCGYISYAWVADRWH